MRPGQGACLVCGVCRVRGEPENGRTSTVNWALSSASLTSETKSISELINSPESIVPMKLERPVTRLLTARCSRFSSSSANSRPRIPFKILLVEIRALISQKMTYSEGRAHAQRETYSECAQTESCNIYTLTTDFMTKFHRPKCEDSFTF